MNCYCYLPGSRVQQGCEQYCCCSRRSRSCRNSNFWPATFKETSGGCKSSGHFSISWAVVLTARAILNIAWLPGKTPSRSLNLQDAALQTSSGCLKDICSSCRNHCNCHDHSKFKLEALQLTASGDFTSAMTISDDPYMTMFIALKMIPSTAAPNFLVWSGRVSP
jgi:hypothetical protein